MTSLQQLKLILKNGLGIFYAYVVGSVWAAGVSWSGIVVVLLIMGFPTVVGYKLGQLFTIVEEKSDGNTDAS